MDRKLAISVLSLGLTMFLMPQISLDAQAQAYDPTVPVINDQYKVKPADEEKDKNPCINDKERAKIEDPDRNDRNQDRDHECKPRPASS